MCFKGQSDSFCHMVLLTNFLKYFLIRFCCLVPTSLRLYLQRRRAFHGLATVAAIQRSGHALLCPGASLRRTVNTGSVFKKMRVGTSFGKDDRRCYMKKMMPFKKLIKKSVKLYTVSQENTACSCVCLKMLARFHMMHIS